MSGTADLAATLEAVAGGDEDAFRQLWDAASPRLYALCLRLMRRRHAAEDVLQESFVRIWQKAHLYDRRLGEPFGWMAALTRNVALDQLRRERSRAAEAELEEGLADQAAEDAPLSDLDFVGTDLVEVWTTREGATAYRVEPGGETALEARLLSSGGVP